MKYDRHRPYNSLPLIPDGVPEFLDTDILTVAAEARGNLGRLDGMVKTLQDPDMLINSIAMREAKDSSEIENIFTTNDELYQELTVETTLTSQAAREVLNYRKALRAGLTSHKEERAINHNVILKIYQALENTSQQFRPHTLQTSVRKAGATITSGKVVYTPPRGIGVIESFIKNWSAFVNSSSPCFGDPLVDLAISHYQFEAIHPFPDGNGRTGRILNVLFLIQKGLLHDPVLYLSGHIVRTKEDYYKLLADITEKSAWKAWVLYFLEAISKTSIFTCSLIAQILSLKEDINNYVSQSIPNFNREIVELTFKQPYIRAIHILDHPSIGIKSRQTATAKLDQLVALNMLSKKIVGRETVYINHQLLSVLSK